MNEARTIHLHKNESLLPTEEIDKIISAVTSRAMSLMSEEIMHRKEAAKFLGIGTRQLDKLTNDKKLPYHRIDGLAAKLYLRSEIIQLIKGS